MVRILGLSAYYHDSSAALLVDGCVIAAAAEERFTRIKHDASFPSNAVEFCLAQADLTAADLDYVVFYEKPLAKFDRILETSLAVTPRGFGAFRQAVPSWLMIKLHLQREVARHLGGQYRRRLLYVAHHLAHAASAFYQSPFSTSAILTVDAVGEWATAGWGIGKESQLEWKQELHFPHSLGLLYSAITEFCGFRVNSGEYELMGLAAYGEPRYLELFKDRLVDLQDDGSFQLRWTDFAFTDSLRMTDERLERTLGVRRRAVNEPIRQVDRDLASSVQQLTEEILLKMAVHVHHQTDASSLCLAGGVMLNCVANGHLLRNSPFERIWIQPAAGDDGGALGAALWVNHQLLARPRVVHRPDAQAGSLLGPSIDNQDVRALQGAGAVFHQAASPEAAAERVTNWLADGKVVGVARGPMEFGPRALGNRSILADPRSQAVQERLNLLIKSRASFRPFGPAVLKEHASAYFDIPDAVDSPYMLICFDCLPSTTPALPAVTHVDGSARLQTVDGYRHPSLHSILTAFYQRTGCPVLLNTSFNTDGEPIVASAIDAYQCFRSAGIDAVLIGDYWAESTSQPDTVQGVWPYQFDTDNESNKLGLSESIQLRLRVTAERSRFMIESLVLSGVYFFLVTPIGWVRRRLSGSHFSVGGSDQAERDLTGKTKTKSYWRNASLSDDPASAFRSY